MTNAMDRDRDWIGRRPARQRGRSMTNAMDRDWIGRTLRMAHHAETDEPQQSIALTLQVIALHLDRIADALEAGR